MRKAQAKQDSEGESYGRRKKPREREDERQKEKNFCEQGHRRKRVTGPAPKQVTAATRSYAIFTRILVGYSAAAIIFVPTAAEALEPQPLSLVRAVAREKAASRQAQAELQECSARRDLAEFLDQRKLRR